jgi:hypothetical protein
MGAQVATPHRSRFELTPADERLQRQLPADEAAQWLDHQDRPLLIEETDLPRGRIHLPDHLLAANVAAHVVLPIVQHDGSVRPHPAGKPALVLDREPPIRIHPHREAGAHWQLGMGHSGRPVAAGASLVWPFGGVLVLEKRQTLAGCLQ